MKTLRYISQGVFLLFFLFLFLLTESAGGDELGYPVRIFLDIDPLICITTFLSSHKVPSALYLSVVTVIVTVIFGRVFCGWICPLGTIHNIAGSLKKSKVRPRFSKFHALKYYVLIFIIMASLFSVQWAGLADPMSLLVRSLALGIYPAFHYSLTTLFDAVYYLQIPGLSAGSEYVHGLFKYSLLAFKEPHYFQSFFISALFIAILLLNLVEKRLWCRYVCPLGALLGILSRYALIERSVSEGCTSCGICQEKCQSGARADTPVMWKKSECIYCMECDDPCPQHAVRFGLGMARRNHFPDLQRRTVLLSGVAGALFVPLIRVSPLSSKSYFNAALIRPPGSLEEGLFLKKCIRCGECMKVCITNGLQPALWQAGIEGLWTPLLVPRAGYCEFRCTLCGQVCPTGAITRLNLAEKETVKIGVAVIDTGRCLPYAFETPCSACQEVCPTPRKAIWLEEVTVEGRDGFAITLKRPKVDPHICIGCGTCEATCPIMAKPAIYVISTGESRSRENRIML
jgi:MauM/NapG family ferredoxin protein